MTAWRLSASQTATPVRSVKFPSARPRPQPDPTMSPAVSLPVTDPPLSDSHQKALRAASLRAEPIRRAARVATFNAWTSAILAGLSAPFALFSVAGAAVFVALALVAWNEFRGRRRLLAYDPTGPTLLGWNQLGLLAVISLYCLWALCTNLWGPSSIASQLEASPELTAAIGSTDGLEALDRTVAIAFYGSVIALSAIFQGASAAYYFSRRKYVETYVRETPAWVIDLERATTS